MTGAEQDKEARTFRRLGAPLNREQREALEALKRAEDAAKAVEPSPIDFNEATGLQIP